MTTTRGVLATLFGAMLLAVVAAPHGAVQSTPMPTSTSTPDASTTTTSITEPPTSPAAPSGDVGGLAATTNLAFTFVDSFTG